MGSAEGNGRLELPAEEALVGQGEAPQGVVHVGVHPGIVQHQVGAEIRQHPRQHARHLAAGRPDSGRCETHDFHWA